MVNFPSGTPGSSHKKTTQMQPWVPMTTVSLITKDTLLPTGTLNHLPWIVSGKPLHQLLSVPKVKQCGQTQHNTREAFTQNAWTVVNLDWTWLWRAFTDRYWTVKPISINAWYVSNLELCFLQDTLIDLQLHLADNCTTMLLVFGNQILQM